LTGEHFFPATYFLLLPLYLTAILVCRSCHVSYRMSPTASLRPIHISYSCCLVTGSAMRVVGLLNTVITLLLLPLSPLLSSWVISVGGFRDTCLWLYLFDKFTPYLFMLIIKLLSRGIGGSADFPLEHGSLVSTNTLGSRVLVI
jgi:hypothetical protein